MMRPSPNYTGHYDCLMMMVLMMMRLESTCLPSGLPTFGCWTVDV